MLALITARQYWKVRLTACQFSLDFYLVEEFFFAALQLK